MTKMLKLSKREFKISMINMLRTLMERVDNMQEQKGNISREVETLRQNQKGILEVKNTNEYFRTKMMTAFAFDTITSRQHGQRKNL